MGKDPQIPATSSPDSGQSHEAARETVDYPETDEETSRPPQEESARKPEDEEDEEEDARESKRRRLSCPSALDTCHPDGQNPGAGLCSFSFDTKIQPMYSTPKFGSFCLGLDFGPPDLGDPPSCRSPEGFCGGEAEGEGGIGLEVETREGVAAVDRGEVAGDKR